MPLPSLLNKWTVSVATVLTLASTSVLAFAARTTPHGSWKTIDDDGVTAKSIVKLYEVEGKLYGRVDRLLQRPGALCDQCEGEDYNKPIEGMIVVWGLSDSDGDGVWEGGKVFDPEKNKTYRCKVWMENGNVVIRGYLGPFFRTQRWQPNV